jgi:type IV pilus assembly protein PilN
VVLFFFHFHLSRQIAELERKITAYNEEIRRLKIDTKDVDKFKAEKEDLQRRLNIIYSLQRAKTGPVRVLDELSMSLPGKLWLTSLREKDGKMELKGLAMDNPTIAHFMTNLEKSGVIKNVELVISQQLERKDLKLKEFTLTCQVDYASSPSEPTS